MGSSGSKATRAAAGAASRKYPTRAPPPSITSAVEPSAPSAHDPGQTIHPEPQASETRTEAITLDATDPVYASQLRSIGPVQTNPILSHSSTSQADPTTNSSSAVSSRARRPAEPTDTIMSQPFPSPQFQADPRTSPALAILEARQRLQEAAAREFESRGGTREFLDMGVVRQILLLRDKRGMADHDIESTLGLKKGVVARLGPKGMVESL